MSQEKPSLNNLIDKYKIKMKDSFPIIDLPDTINPKYVLTSIIAVFSVIFYFLGYIFLYGLYFGGTENGNVSFIKVIVNPVPFNFKSVLLVGVIFLINTSLFIYPLYKLRQSLKTKNIIIFTFNSLILLLLSIIIYIFIVLCFKGKFDGIVIEKHLFVSFWFSPLLFLFYIILYSVEKLNTLVGILNGFIIVFFFNLSIKIFFNTDINFIKYSKYFILFCIIYAAVILLSKDRLKKYLIRYPIIYVITFTLFLLIFSKINLNIPVILFYCISLILPIILMLLPFKYFKSSFSKFTKLNIFINKFITAKDVETIKTCTLYLFFAFTLTCSIIFIAYGIYNSGKAMQTILPTRQLEKIQYFTNDSTKPIRELYGNIVASSDNIYFISDSNYKLVIVKSNMLLIEQKK